MNAIAASWRCFKCGALYPEHSTSCAACWESGTIVRLAVRPRAAMDSLPARATARDLARLSWADVPHACYPSLRLGVKALALVVGPPSAGKSTLALRLLDSIPGPVLLISAEEGLGPTLSERLLRCRVKRSDFHVIASASVDACVEEVRRTKARAVCLDSVQMSSWLSTDLRHLLEVVEPLELVLAVNQVTKEGRAAGAMALLHEADVILRVEEGAATLEKSRYQDCATFGAVSVLQPVQQETP